MPAKRVQRKTDSTPARDSRHMVHTAKNMLGGNEVAGNASAAEEFNRQFFAPLYRDRVSPAIVEIEGELKLAGKGAGSQARIRELAGKLAAASSCLQEEAAKRRTEPGANEPVFGQMAHLANSALGSLLTYLGIFNPEEKSERMDKARLWVENRCGLVSGLFEFYAAITPGDGRLADALMGSTGVEHVVEKYREISKSR